MKRIIVLLVALVAAAPLTAGAQRFGRARAGRGIPGDGVSPAQVWRVPTLTMAQRLKLHDLQTELFTSLRDAQADGSGRRDLLAALAGVERRLATIVSAEQMDAARSEPRGPLAPEEVIYFAIRSLPDLDAARRAKIDAIYTPVLVDARTEAAGRGGFGRGRGGGDAAAAAGREQERSAQRQRRIALFEVTEALLTADQMIAVKRFIPDQLKMVGLKEKIVFRLPSLTLEQEAQVRAIFAALEDETAADKARLKALAGERRNGGAAGGSRDANRSERRDLAGRVEERERRAYDELAKVLTPEQVKELAARAPGPPRPVVFTIENLRAIDDLTPSQQTVLRVAMITFNRATGDERREARDLRERIKGGDPQSMEMAGVRDQLRQVGSVVQVEHDRIVRTVADTLTGPQLARLVAQASAEKPKRP